MSIDLAGRGRKRLVLGLLAAGIVGVTALGGAAAASAEEPGTRSETLPGPIRSSFDAALKDRPDLEADCRNKNGTPVSPDTVGGVHTERAPGGENTGRFWYLQVCHFPINPNEHLDFFSFV